MVDFYIDGTTRKNDKGTIALTRTSKGWTQRAVRTNDDDDVSVDFAATVNRDYVSNETEEQIMEWVRLDFKSWSVRASDLG